MCRNVLIVLLIVAVVLMAAAAFVVIQYGWPGFLVLVVALVVMAVAFKYLAPRLLPRLFLGAITRPMREMGKVLRGARLTVHSVAPTHPPEPTPDDEAPDDRPHRLGYRDDPPDEDDAETDDADEDEETDPANLDWYAVDFTIAPRDGGSSEGRMVTRTGWNPGLLSFHRTKADRPPRPAGLPAMFDQFGGPEVLLDRLERWTGSDFVDAADAAEEAEVFGDARFRARIGVDRKIGTVLLMYAHFTEVGEIRIPRIDITPGRHS